MPQELSGSYQKSLPSHASLLKMNAVACYVTVCFSDVAMVYTEGSVGPWRTSIEDKSCHH